MVYYSLYVVIRLSIIVYYALSVGIWVIIRLSIPVYTMLFKSL